MDDPDDTLVSELREYFARVDPVPPLVTEAAKAALGWRRLDADLAELLSDSSDSSVLRSENAPVRQWIVTLFPSDSRRDTSRTGTNEERPSLVTSRRRA